MVRASQALRSAAVERALLEGGPGRAETAGAEGRVLQARAGPCRQQLRVPSVARMAWVGIRHSAGSQTWAHGLLCQVLRKLLRALSGVPSCQIALHCLPSSFLRSAGTSVAVQWFRLRLPTQGVRVRSLVGELRSHMPCGQKIQNIKQKQYCNKFSKDFKNGPHKKN